MKNGTFARGWQLTKSSWQVLRLDKELTVLPVISLICTVIALITLVALAILILGTAGLAVKHSGMNFSFAAPAWLNIVAVIIASFVITFIANFFSGALIYGATQRFKGVDPTIRSSVAGARRKFYPLAGFSLLMSTVGLILQALEERLPFAGAIAVRILGAAWSIANIFAIPVIVLSEANVQPLDATKQSIQTIKKVWGEGVIANIGISLIGGLGVLAYVLLAAALGILGGVLHLPAALGIVAVIVAFIGLLVLALVLSALSSIAKAALYYYAVTGTAPQSFNHELLQAAITRKKARRIFS